LFAQKRNWLNPRFYQFISEILRFNKLAKQEAKESEVNLQTLGQFLNHHGFSHYFCENYILPMGAAIWSSSLADMRAFPLTFFLRFFLNHGLLDISNRPKWNVIQGGSRSYIEPLTQGFKHNIRTSSPVDKVKRVAGGVEVTSLGKTEWFDEVIFACHSDQALSMLEDATKSEQQILSQLGYQANEVILHIDTSLLPKRKAAWASWNYWLRGDEGQDSHLPSLTYNMNILQHIDAPETFCVSLNSSEHIDPNKILRSFVYHHPVFTEQSIKAQQRKTEISGENHTWFCGAYWHNGFHEDGVRSALDVVTNIARANEAKMKGAA
jgi:predicted NAD/FAD-binding protein